MRLYERWEAATALAFATFPPPPRMAIAARHLWRWRTNPAGIVVAGARIVPDRVAIVDDERTRTFGDLGRRSSAIARTWRGQGIGVGTTIGLLAENSGRFFEAMTAAHMLGADLVFVNTSFAAPQVADVVAREGIEVLVHDDALTPLAALAATTQVVPMSELAAAAESADGPPLPPPERTGRVVVLTSGTTGHPKGAARGGGGNPLDTAGILSCLPLGTGDTTVVGAPLFHGLGLFTASLALALRSTVVLRTRFEAEQALADVSAHDAQVLVVVPAMLRRILALGRRRLALHDTSSLRVVLCGGAALPGELAHRFMDVFGEVLFNIYGSTEVAMATVGSPRDLRRAPGTAGRPVPGVRVHVLDERGQRVPPGTVGRIFVGSALRFDGYTGGGAKDSADGLVATGDLGRLDRSGRLFVEGREDDMIISGGENLFPAEVEEVLVAHPAVFEAAAVGVADEEFGQRLRAFVVRTPGATVDADTLRRHVRENLARFKVPRDIIFMDELPRTATGKVRKRELEQLDVTAGAAATEEVETT